MEENEKIGKLLIDGKVVDLDTATISELETIEDKLKVDIEKIKKIISDKLFSDVDSVVEL